MPPARDLVGQQFHRWTVLRRAGLSRDKKVLWECRCECGNNGHVTSGNLIQDVSRQCRECADRHADHGSPRVARPKEEKRCLGCDQAFSPKRRTAKYCSVPCKSKYRWRTMDAAARKEHCQRVCKSSQQKRDVRHAACEQCGKAFAAPPSRKFCSRACLEIVIRSGKYRSAFHQRRVEREFAALGAALQKIMENKND